MDIQGLVVTLVQFFCIIHGQRWNSVGSDDWSRDYDFFRQRNNPNVCSYETCRLPKCFCAGKDAPRKMDPSVIPQIVMFTFDDAVNEQVFDYYLKLFPEESVNPNGCPISVTFFVSHNWTDYDMVKKLYDRGHEIASHSITHRMPQSWWRYGPAEDWEMEIQGQKKNIAEKASIPLKEIRGMRAPFLDTGGDEQFKMLEKHGFEYDASFMTGPHDKGGAWPFTLNFVPSWEYCTNLNCPKEKHPGIWEIPLNRWVGIDGNGCSMVDACQQQPSHKGETLAYLWQNFNRHYYGNRSPVGVNMHATWFKTPHHFEAMQEFVKTISEMNDVYILTVHQTLEWIKNPRTIDRVVNFRPWLKTCKGSVSVPNNVKEEKSEPEVVLSSVIEPKQLHSESFDDGQIYMDNFNQEPTSNDYHYVPRNGRRQTISGELSYRKVDTSAISRPVNIDNEIIQDYRFTERSRIRPISRSNSNIENMFHNSNPQRRRRPPLSREINNYQRQEINENNNYPLFENLETKEVANVIQENNNPIFPEEIARYEIYEDNLEEIGFKNAISEERSDVLVDAKEQIENKVVNETSILKKVQFQEKTKENIQYEQTEKNENKIIENAKIETSEIINRDIEGKQYHGNEELDSVNVQSNVDANNGKSIEGTKEDNEEIITEVTSTLQPTKETNRPPLRVRPRGPYRPRQGGIPGRTDLQSRKRNRALVNSANSQQLNIAVLVTSGTIAILLHHQISWL